MKRLMLNLLSLLFLIVFGGCEHRELVEPTEKHYVRVYLDEHIRNVHYGFYDETKKKPEYKAPTMMRVTLNDLQSGKMRAETYLRNTGTDERGNYVEGYIVAAPGTYNLMAYSFDTQSTHVSNEDDYYQMEVYTNPISEELFDKLVSVRSENGETGGSYFDKENIRYEPDHFFVAACEGIQVADKLYADTLHSNQGKYFTAQTAVETYYMQVNIKGIEHVKSATSLITGMAGATRMSDFTLISDPPACVYFNLQPGMNEARKDENIAVAYASFNTFGKLKEVEGFIEVTFEFNTKYETTQVETIRVSDMFETEQVKNKRWIIIDKVIEIIPPDDVSEGMTPGVNNWENIEGNLTI